MNVFDMKTRPLSLILAAAVPLCAQIPGSVAVSGGTVAISGAYAGSVPALQSADRGEIKLSLAEAIQYGLKANLGAITGEIDTRAARANRLQALSALLPNIYGQLSETVTQVNLAAYGFQFKLPPGLNFSIPSVVGPFSYSSGAANLSSTIWDSAKRRRYEEAKEAERGAVLNAKDARELVVLAVSGTYLRCLAYAARVQAQQAQVASAQAVYNQAVARKSAGTEARIEVTRSAVELQSEQQRLNTDEAEVQKELLSLARIIGLPQDRVLTLSESLSPVPVTVPEARQEIEQAQALRSDVRAAESQLKAAELALSAVHAERFPTVSVSGDYGALGPNPTSAHGVFAVTGSVNIPIYSGGRIRADLEQAEATLARRRAELADKRAAVEQEVRNALIELGTANGQVRLASSNRDLAEDTLKQARDRFAAGVSTTLEVVQAQQQLASANADYINSLFALDLARLSLARATGQTETEISNLLKVQ